MSGIGLELLASALLATALAPADSIRACQGRFDREASSVSAAIFVNNRQQVDLGISGLTWTAVPMQKTALPFTGVSLTYAISNARAPRFELRSVELSHNGGSGDCGSGDVIVQANGREVFRQPYRSTVGFCALRGAVDPEESTTPRTAKITAETIARASRLTVRFVTSDGRVVGEAQLSGLDPRERTADLERVFLETFRKSAALEGCQPFVSQIFPESMLPRNWADGPS
ncbi:MAG: hypothetical protein Q8Q88_02980 [Phenylobacterium sp.]|uniref:hypothetical protein n=1 Tax=Phenylobacterium sp. TaxID=1871053 RepID=UPI0027374A28|nr:hypothetical protein [Phenylobacterium sp.]MDP3745992.1 hypothetical protein [Phenylobacterium sp.]